MTRHILALLTTAMLAGCGKAPAPATVLLDHGWAPPGACIFLGNRPDRHFCATTGTQILANPQIYDGQLVDVSGWVVSSPDGKDVGLFLTKDALETASLQGSVRLTGPGKAAIAAYANRASAHFTPVQVRVTGRFHLYGLTSEGDRVKKSPRFGVIDEVEGP